MKVASYNILANSYTYPKWYPDTDPRLLKWDYRKDFLVRRIVALEADILCLQEVEEPVFAFLTEELDGYQGVFAQKGRRKKDGCAAFFRPPVIDSNQIFYNDQHKGGPSGHLFQIIKFADFSVANTHIKWDPPETPPEDQVGLKQTHQLLSHIQANPGPWIVCGDFNGLPNTQRIKAMHNAGFTDPANRPTCNINQTPQQLDYIFVNGLTSKPEETNPVTLLMSEQEPSDHLPVVATIAQP